MIALLFLMTATDSSGSSNKIFIIDALVKVITKIMANFLFYFFMATRKLGTKSRCPAPPTKKIREMLNRMKVLLLSLESLARV